MKIIGGQGNVLAAVLAAKIGKGRKKRLEIKPDRRFSRMAQFSELAPLIYQALDREGEAEVWLREMPFCAVNERSRDHILPARRRGEKTAECRGCRYFKNCAGFPAGYFKKYGQREVCPVADRPAEVMMELEPRCNFDCDYCFNKKSFAARGRNIQPLSGAYLKKIIDGVAAAGVKIVRFTGGEPLLRKDIFKLGAHAKRRGLEVRLNTNGYLLTPVLAARIAAVFDNVLISIESDDEKIEGRLSGRPDALRKKIAAVRALKLAGLKVVRAGTVATAENIKNFDKLAAFILKLPVDEWELYRPMSQAGGLSRQGLGVLVNKIREQAGRTGKIISLANAAPFCALPDKNKINTVSNGALFDDGHSRLVIDPRGFVKPHYFLDKRIGDPLDILAAWYNPFMKKMRTLKFLPRRCRRCDFKWKCRGGSRYLAKEIFGRWSAPDPLLK